MCLIRQLLCKINTPLLIIKIVKCKVLSGSLEDKFRDEVGVQNDED